MSFWSKSNSISFWPLKNWNRSFGTPTRLVMLIFSYWIYLKHRYIMQGWIALPLVLLCMFITCLCCTLCSGAICMAITRMMMLWEPGNTQTGTHRHRIIVLKRNSHDTVWPCNVFTISTHFILAVAWLLKLSKRQLSWNNKFMKWTWSFSRHSEESFRPSPSPPRTSVST